MERIRTRPWGIFLVLVVIFLVVQVWAVQQGETKESIKERNKLPDIPTTGNPWMLVDPVKMFRTHIPKLNLSAEQNIAIRKILDTNKPTLDLARYAYFSSLQTLKESAYEGIDKQVVIIREDATEVGKALGNLMTMAAEVHIKLKEKLTPEQRRILRELNNPQKVRPQQTPK